MLYLLSRGCNPRGRVNWISKIEMVGERFRDLSILNETCCAMSWAMLYHVVSVGLAMPWAVSYCTVSVGHALDCAVSVGHAMPAGRAVSVGCVVSYHAVPC